LEGKGVGGAKEQKGNEGGEENTNEEELPGLAEAEASTGCQSPGAKTRKRAT
jgi:hypothetical protein